METIAKNLKDGTYSSNPVMASEDHAKLAGDYFFVCGQLEDVLKIKATKWNDIRQNAYTKSDKQADKIWDATENGINEMSLRLREKSIGKMMSALKSLIRIAEGQAKNLY